MSLGKVIRSRLVASLALATLVALLGVAMRAPDGPLGDGLVKASYDTLHQIAGKQTDALANSSVVIVYLDLNSFLLKRQDPMHPWPRDLHAQLLRQLTASGAKAVVFDIIFSAPGADVVADRNFSDAIRESRRVILAGESNDSASHETSEDKPWGRIRKTSPPLAHFATNAVAWGIASHIVDDDFVVRRYLAGFTTEALPSLTWAAAQWLEIPATRRPDAARTANARWIRYYGPALPIPPVS